MDHNKDIYLMTTCLGESFFPSVLKNTLEILESLGCNVTIPMEQTCCGQPAFNSGDFDASKKIALNNLNHFSGNNHLVVPSGSCTAMHRHGNLIQFEKDEVKKEIEQMGKRTIELIDFIYNILGIKKWAGRLEKTIAIHHSCHTRNTATGNAIESLLSSIEGIKILTFGQGEQCCGFGGTFSVSYPYISKKVGDLKIEHVLSQSPDLLVSSDMSCLMHIKGLADKTERQLEISHVIDVLHEAMNGSSNE